jgi:hypothetical protein
MIKEKYNSLLSPLLVQCIVLLGLTTGALAQAQNITGVWRNETEGLKLTLNSDSSGELVVGAKAFQFVGSYSIKVSNSSLYLDFKIQVGDQVTPCYAIVKHTSDSTIKYLSFLSEELRDAATEETVQTGVLLTKEQ